ncbi:hypothetical protein ACEU59_21605 [Buttiauxella noackiae]
MKLSMNIMVLLIVLKSFTGGETPAINVNGNTFQVNVITQTK